MMDRTDVLIPNLFFGRTVRQRPPRPPRRPEWLDPDEMDMETANLADFLHGSQCNASHIDECGYQYESWPEPRWSKTSWYRGAERMVHESEQPAAVVLAVLRAAKSWIAARGRNQR